MAIKFDTKMKRDRVLVDLLIELRQKSLARDVQGMDPAAKLRRETDLELGGRDIATLIDVMGTDGFERANLAMRNRLGFCIAFRTWLDKQPVLEQEPEA